MINKNSLLKKLIDNFDLFKTSKFFSQMTVKEIFNKICNPTDKEPLINNDITLTGILLGYGRNNSIAFGRRSFIQNLEPVIIGNDKFNPEAVINIGFMCIQNGTNELENKTVYKEMMTAKKKVEKEFNEKKYFNKFIRLYMGCEAQHTRSEH